MLTEGISALIALGSLIYGIISAVKTAKSRDQFEIDQTCRKEFMQNIQMPFIVDISISSKNSCTNYSYHDDNYGFYRWPGVDSFCVCDEKMQQTGKCSAEQLNSGCKSIMYDYGQIFDSLKLLSNNGYLCFERLKTENFLEFLKDQNGKCDTDSQKQCGNPSLPETIICVEKDDKCPIYQIIELEKEDNKKTTDLGWKVIKLQSSFLYYDSTGQTATSLPISQVIVGDAKAPPGTYLAEHNINISTQEIDNSSNCSSFEHFSENNWVNTNIQMKRQDFYKENFKEEEFKEIMFNDDLRQKYQSDNKQVGIYYRPYFSWNVENRSELGTLNKGFDDYKELSTTIDISLSLQIVKVVYCDVAVNAFYVFVYMSEGKVDKTLLMMTIVSVLNLAFIIATIVVTNATFTQARDCNDIFESLNSSNVSTEFVKYSIETFSDLTEDIRKDAVVALVLPCLNLVKFSVEFFVVLLIICKNR